MQPCHWAVERRLAWLIWSQRLAKDDERMMQTIEALIEPTAIRLLRRLAAAHSGSEGTATRYQTRYQ